MFFASSTSQQQEPLDSTIVTDSNLQIIQFRGQADLFLRQTASSDLFTALDTSLHSAIRTALRLALQHDQTSHTRTSIVRDAQPVEVAIEVTVVPQGRAGDELIFVKLRHGARIPRLNQLIAARLMAADATWRVPISA